MMTISMGSVRRSFFATAFLLSVVVPALAVQQAPSTIRLWPGKAPGEQAELPPEQARHPADGNPAIVTSLTNVSDPSLAVFAVPRDRANGTAIVIAPGGGYSNLAWDHEGEQIARWFNKIGVSAFVLKYRVPRRANDPEALLPLADAQRAISIVRARAREWGIDPQKIGLLGFSAGGHLTAHASNRSDRRAYDAVDEADSVSCRPDFAVLIYPGGLIPRQQPAGEPPGALAANVRPSAQTPPSFVVVAADDRGSFDSSVKYFLACKEAGVKSELHVYAGGGHGFGIRPTAGVTATWTDRCADWMRGVGMLPAAKP